MGDYHFDGRPVLWAFMRRDVYDYLMAIEDYPLSGAMEGTCRMYIDHNWMDKLDAAFEKNDFKSIPRPDKSMVVLHNLHHLPLMSSYKDTPFPKDSDIVKRAAEFTKLRVEMLRHSVGFNRAMSTPQFTNYEDHIKLLEFKLETIRREFAQSQGEEE